MIVQNNIKDKIIDEASKWMERYIPVLADIEPNFTDYHQDIIVPKVLVECFKEDMEDAIVLTDKDKKMQCINYLREQTGLGFGLISTCFETLIEKLKQKPHHKMDVGQSLKMEWQEYDLRK